MLSEKEQSHRISDCAKIRLYKNKKYTL